MQIQQKQPIRITDEDWKKKIFFNFVVSDSFTILGTTWNYHIVGNVHD